MLALIENLNKLDEKIELDYMKKHLNDFKKNIDIFNYY